MMRRLVAAWRGRKIGIHCNRATDRHSVICILLAPVNEGRCAFNLPIED